MKGRKMKRDSGYVVIAYVLALGFVTAVRGQTTLAIQSSARTDAAPTRKPSMSPEENLVRAAYEKLTMLNSATLRSTTDNSRKSSEEDVLRFELRNFRVGPIAEIIGVLHSEIKTEGTGDTVYLSRSITRLSKDEEEVAYKAEWTTGQYASSHDRNWTVGDLLGFESNLYYDVGEYALYDVTVSFKGKTRAYRALALFHNPFGSTENLRPSFWDSVVGAGGALTEVWNEKRSPVGQKTQY
jgi:hypothetical protein